MTITHRPDESSPNWETPPAVVAAIEHYLGISFDLDPCASHENHKASTYFTEEDNGLAQDWGYKYSGWTYVFMNPPYGRETPAWVEKMYWERMTGLVYGVALIVPRTDTVWWHQYVAKASAVHFLQGRVPFKDPLSDRTQPQDPSCLVVFDPGHAYGPELHHWNWKQYLYENLGPERYLEVFPKDTKFRNVVTPYEST